MKPSSAFQVMNQKQPLLVMTDKLLQSVRRIVGRSDLEAQWFHTVNRVEDKNRIFFILENLLIPKQYVSGAFVETTPEFQVEYWNSLVEKFGSNEAASTIVKTSGVWCHSHVNMIARPSGTDEATFNDHCKDAADSGNPTPQLMLIFNKKDEFYSRVWDPVTQRMYEGLELVTTEAENYTDLDKEMDDKFLKRPSVQVSKEGISAYWSKQNPRPTNGTQIPTAKKSRATPVDLSKSDYTKFHDALEKYLQDGLAEDIGILRELVDKYLSDHYMYSMFQMSFASATDIKRLCTKFFISREFYSTVGDTAKERFWERIMARQYDCTRIATALDRTIDLAATDKYVDAIETVNGFIQDCELVEPKSPHTRIDVEAWGRNE